MDEAEAGRLLGQMGDAIVAGVERCLGDWCVRQVDRILDAWGRLDGEARSQVTSAARDAGSAATDRISADLRALLAAPPERQAATPLEAVRTAYREPTAVLGSAGIPPVERDAFDERAWPDDVYGLVPQSLTDLGDDQLGELLRAWGLAKAAYLRARLSA